MLSVLGGQHDIAHLGEAYNAAVLTRRSLSIFSRRGIESPEEPKLDARSCIQPPSSTTMNNRMSSFKKRISKGTILNAVPMKSPASKAKKTIGIKNKSSPLDFACEGAAKEIPWLKQDTGHSNQRQSGHKRGKHSEERLGVWVDGVVHWDDNIGNLQANKVELEPRPSTSYTRPRAKTDLNMRAHKPSLSVVIPGSDRKHETSTQPHKSTLSVQERKSYHTRKHHSADSNRIVSPLRSTRDSFQKPSQTGTAQASGSTSPKDDPSRTSSNASSSVARGNRSFYSNRSSSTSIEDITAPCQPAKEHDLATKTTTPHLKITNDVTPITKSYTNKPLPPTPPTDDVPQSQSSPQTMEAHNLNFPIPPRSNKNITKNKDLPVRKNNRLRRVKSGSRLDEFDKEFMRTSPYNAAAEHASSEPNSPTLSQAESDREELQGRLSRHISMLDIHTRGSAQEPPLEGLRILNLQLPTSSQVVPVPEQPKSDTNTAIVQPPSRAPTIPKKSSKRDWPTMRPTESTAAPEALEAAPARRLSDSMTPVNDAPDAVWWTAHRLSRSVSSPALPKVEAVSHVARTAPALPSRFALDDGLIVVHGPVVMRPSKSKAVDAPAAQEAAEGVLVSILATLTNMDDLVNTILINKGMHRVYLENQMHLIKTVCRNQSPPAWEMREWCPQKHDDNNDDGEVVAQCTPAVYLRGLKQDTAVINELKKVIVAECASFIRKDTTASMADARHAQAQRVTDAFWRIWTFCTVFGSRKGRDEDLTGQLDWLKGGRVANNLDCAATVNVQFDFGVESVLLNAPEYFGQGNGNGLSADELYDITEIWTCMAVLLQGYLGRIEQAREYGVYDNCSVQKGDVEEEEYMLEEWIAWILTFGPTAVLEMSRHASDPTPTGFILAKERGWTSWAPPVYTTSRVTFLKEPVARLYEERVTAANTNTPNAREQQEKENSRKRIAAHALEIKIRRQDSAFKRVPLIDMSMERPMSILSTLSGGAVLTPRFPPRLMTLPPIPPPPGVHPALRLNASSLFSCSTSSPLRNAIPEQREALRTLNGVAVDTVEIAIQRIVSMGFSEEQAKIALRTTDTGDGLRVDRAVDMLLRSHNVAPEWA